MAKRKAGLHKTVSAIFDGVPLPGRDSTDKPPEAAAPERPNVQAPPKPHEEPPKKSSTAAKPAAPSHMTPTKPKPPQPVESPAKPSPPKVTKPKTAKAPPKEFPGQQVWQQIKSKLLTPKPGVSAQKQKTMVIMIPVLLIVMIFAFMRVLKTPSPATAQATESGPTSTVDSPKGIEWQIPEPYPTTLRDPMQIDSVPTDTVKTSELVVKGIVYSEDDPSAVIGDRIVHEGDEIMGAIVIKIKRDNVVFEMDGKEWTQQVER